MADIEILEFSIPVSGGQILYLSDITASLGLQAATSDLSAEIWEELNSGLRICIRGLFTSWIRFFCISNLFINYIS